MHDIPGVGFTLLFEPSGICLEKFDYEIGEECQPERLKGRKVVSAEDKIIVGLSSAIVLSIQI